MIVQALNAANVRFIVVGGLAVNAHGYIRVTNDVDIVVRLERADVVAAFNSLARIGYFPAVPVTGEQFADPALRQQWREEKGMLVLKFWSDQHRETPLDVFVYEPFDFDLEYERALRGSDPRDPQARFASIAALIAMKTAAGRDTDMIDIARLRQIDDLQNR